jgi:DNA-binding winged helix-turn-helix (wHTH) protein
MPVDPVAVWRFDDYELDPLAAELRRDGDAVPLPPQQFLLLSTLVAAAGALVTREQLRTRLWGDDVTVDFDAGLNFCIRQLRLTLHDSATHPRFIQTVPRRGYRFIAPVTGLGADHGDGDPGRRDAAPEHRGHQTAPPSRWTSAAAVLAVLAMVAGAVALWRTVDTGVAASLPADARIADAHAARGFVALNDDWQWVVAERAFARALQLDPRHEVALISMSRLRSAQSRSAAAVTFALRAVDAHPGSARARTTLGWALLFGGNAREAARTCEQVLATARTSASARACLAQARAELGLTGRSDWNAFLTQARTRVRQDDWFQRATVEARTGNLGAALDSLQRALRAREPDATFALVHPALAALRNDPAFVAATEAAGLTPVR